MRFLVLLAVITLLLPPVLLFSISKGATQCGLVHPVTGSATGPSYTLPGPGGDYGLHGFGYGWLGTGSECTLILADGWYELPMSLPVAFLVALGAAAFPWLAILGSSCRGGKA